MIPKARIFNFAQPWPLLENQTVVGILEWNEAAGLSDCEQTHLTPAERTERGRLGSERRKTEWLAARVCLKESLLRQRIIRNPQDCEVGKDDQGRPRLRIRSRRDGAPRIDCALSHAGRLALSAWMPASGVQVGADLVMRSAGWARLCSAFIRPEDEADPDLEAADQGAVLWTLKEAASKALGTGLGGALNSAVRRVEGTLCRIESGDGRVLSGRYRVGPGWVLAVAWLFERSHS